MVKPDPNEATNNYDAQQQADIEKYFDEALTAGEREIDEPRAGWAAHNIAAVLDKYRAYWNVTARGNTYMFTAKAPS